MPRAKVRAFARAAAACSLADAKSVETARLTRVYTARDYPVGIREIALVEGRMKHALYSYSILHLVQSSKYAS